jgi:hypothetical protein
MKKKKNLIAAEGRALGRRYIDSGKTRGEFAKEAGVTVPMVQYWASKIRREARTSVPGPLATSTPAFVQIVAKESVAVSYQGGATLEMHCARLRFDTLPTTEYVAQLAIEMARRTGC